MFFIFGLCDVGVVVVALLFSFKSAINEELKSNEIYSILLYTVDCRKKLFFLYFSYTFLSHSCSPSRSRSRSLIMV